MTDYKVLNQIYCIGLARQTFPKQLLLGLHLPQFPGGHSKEQDYIEASCLKVKLSEIDIQSKY